MRMLRFGRLALSVGVAAVSLAACGAQPLSGAPGTMPQVPARRAASSGSYQLLYRFHPEKNGMHPPAGLLDLNGTLYGTTEGGGSAGNSGYGDGTVFSISPTGVEKVLHRFDGGSDGSSPESDLVAINGTLYGTTYAGGSSNDGTVFSISPSHVEKVLYSFKGGKDGELPLTGLIDVDGTLYGTTSQGGIAGCYNKLGCGTVFSMTTSGREKILHRFYGPYDGQNPAADLLDVKGVLYGTTVDGGGSCSCGAVFSITRSGFETVLYKFKGSQDGSNPLGALVDANGVLYGTTADGGTPNGNGTVYRVSIKGVEKVIYRFAGGDDGMNPDAGVVDVNGVLYGTTANGGAGGSCWSQGQSCGTVFSVTTSGAENVIYRFTGGRNGLSPRAPLVDLNGTLYGTTYQGGYDDTCCYVYGMGTVFTVSP